MGVFFERKARETKSTERVRQLIEDAISLPSDPSKAAERAESITNEAFGALGSAELQTGRVVIALALFVVLAAGGLYADVTGHAGSSSAFYGFAGTVFGVVAGFLGVEKSAAG